MNYDKCSVFFIVIQVPFTDFVNRSHLSPNKLCYKKVEKTTNKIQSSFWNPGRGFVYGQHFGQIMQKRAENHS